MDYAAISRIGNTIYIISDNPYEDKPTVKLIDASTNQVKTDVNVSFLVDSFMPRFYRYWGNGVVLFVTPGWEDYHKYIWEGVLF